MTAIGTVGITDVSWISIGQTIKQINNSSESAIGQAYQVLISPEAYEKFKETHAEELSRATEEAAAARGQRSEMVVHELGYNPTTRSTQSNSTAVRRSGTDVTLGIDPDAILDFRQDFMKENLSDAAKKMANTLYKNTGTQVLSQLKNADVTYNAREKLCIVGADLLEFMANNNQYQSIWDGIASGKYSTLKEVDAELRSSNHSDIANELKSVVVGKPPEATLIRTTISNAMDVDLGPLHLGKDEITERKVYANSVITDELIKQYQSIFQKQNEKNADRIYEQRIRTSESLKNSL